jgi:hypothetical protein
VQVCVGGWCGACTNDDQCPNGFVCQDGACVPEGRAPWSNYKMRKAKVVIAPTVDLRLGIAFIIPPCMNLY